MNITCSNIESLISAYLDGELTEDEMTELNEHFESCRDCRLKFNEIKGVVNLLRNLDDEELPETFSQDLHERLMKESRKEFGRRFLRNPFIKLVPAAAACLLLVFVLRGSLLPNLGMKKTEPESAAGAAQYGLAAKVAEDKFADRGETGQIMAAMDAPTEDDTIIDENKEENSGLKAFSVIDPPDVTLTFNEGSDALSKVSGDINIVVYSDNSDQQVTDIIEYAVSNGNQVLDKTQISENKKNISVARFLTTPEKLNVLKQYLETRYETENVEYEASGEESIKVVIDELNKELDEINARLNELNTSKDSNPEEKRILENRKNEIEKQLEMYKSDSSNMIISVTVIDE